MSDQTKALGPCEQVHLAAKNKDGKRTGYSGRAVRYRLLSSDEVSHIERECSKLIKPGTTNFEFSEAIASMGAQAMVTEVTEGPVDREGLPTAKWMKVTQEQMLNSWSSFFNAKDTAVLKKLYQVDHGVNDKELEEIVEGKVSYEA